MEYHHVGGVFGQQPKVLFAGAGFVARCPQVCLVLALRADVAGHAKDGNHVPIGIALRNHLQGPDHDGPILAVVLVLASVHRRDGTGCHSRSQLAEVRSHFRCRLRGMNLIQRLGCRFGRGNPPDSLHRRADIGDGAIDRHSPDHIPGVFNQQPVALLTHIQRSGHLIEIVEVTAGV